MDLKWKTKECKASYRRKMEDHLQQNNARESPKTSHPKEPNHFRPVALTSHLMKTLERHRSSRHLRPLEHSKEGSTIFVSLNSRNCIIYNQTTSRGPTVFPLMQCGSGAADTVTLGCLATGFTPPSLTYAWTKSGTALPDFIQYPAVQKDDSYTGVSGCREADVDVKITGPKMEDLFLKQRPVIVCEVKGVGSFSLPLEIEYDEWNQGVKFNCIVEHSEWIEPLKTLYERNIEPRIVSPNISLYPVWEGDFGASAVRLICTISGFFPDSLSVNWQQNDQDINIPRIDTKLRSVDEAGKTFSLSSEIEPNLKQWTDGSSFTCKSIHKRQGI
ncbi:hypothetical protein L3Q82_002789 [Scortum barcoo]|uniref:Uncharacterized protein n=1 Tax=Scortum barcoo TaxID=214431 RepID=A0ACB8VWH3_9TELE|nr:hypothetical protein L3Q82_002789 [Scortum barcoo]